MIFWRDPWKDVDLFLIAVNTVRTISAPQYPLSPYSRPLAFVLSVLKIQRVLKALSVDT